MQLPASATLADAPALLDQLQQALTSDGPLQVDAGALQNFDTSAIALLMQARRQAQAAGRTFSVVRAPAKLAELARLYGVEELLSLAPPSPSAAAAPSGVAA
jgi:phospholipid transport system transporter-binding protein